METLIYCYDAYCDWCYGFSEVIKKINSEYKGKLNFEVLSGGLILPKEPVTIAAIANYTESIYKNIEEVTGIKFGEDYLWHIKHPNVSDWFPNSEKPAIALCVFKEYYPDKQISFAADLQYALHFEGRDLTDDQSYHLLLDKYNIPVEDFFENLDDEKYKKQAYEEFDLCKQLNVSGFPAVFIQLSETKFHKIAEGYTDFEILNERITNRLKEDVA
ncbi:MAG: DsbA family protein [Ginsengibacter sp.]